MRRGPRGLRRAGSVDDLAEEQLGAVGLRVVEELVRRRLFDEPTSALDPELVGEVLATIRGLAQEKRTMVIVTHEMSFARDVANRAIFIDKGVIVEQGDAKTLFAQPREERTRQFLSKFLNPDQGRPE